MALKDQTDDLLSKENVKDAAMFGAEFIPGVGEALAIKRTSDALDKKDYLGAGIEATAGLLGIIPGVGDLAGKGLRVATKNFRKADVDEAEKLLENPEKLQKWRDPIDKGGNRLPESQRQKNIPEAQQAAEDLFQGNIKSKEARKRIKDVFPEPKLYTAETMPEMPTVTDVVGSMGKKSEKGILGVKGFDLEPGQRVGARLDIPAYNEYDKWVVSIHDGNSAKGSVVGYGQAIRLKNITFGSDPKVALDIARKKVIKEADPVKGTPEKRMGKATIARVFGDYVPEDPYELQMFAKKVLADKDSGWTQVGMNPYRGSYFYDKATGTPVTRADEVIQVGPLVLAKNVTKPKMSELKKMFKPAARTAEGKLRVFSEGGVVPMNRQMDMFQKGGLEQDGGTTDPVSGNEVPPGSTQEEVRDDIPAQLSEGEFVMPADVVRFHGLDKMMQLRQEAKMGLKIMEEMGQMGNSEEATIPDDLPFNFEDLELDDEPREMQVGGYVAPQIQPLATQQSQFTNYTPQVNVPTQLPTTSYTAPTQQITPTAPAISTLPTFDQVVPPPGAPRKYINPETGAILMIPVDGNGNLMYPPPAGYILFSEYEASQPPATDPVAAPTTAPQQQQGRDDPSDEPSTFVRTDQFGRTMDDDASELQQTKEFVQLNKKIDPRGTLEKIKDDFLGLVGASTTSEEYQKAARQLAVSVSQYTTNPAEQRELLADIESKVGAISRTASGDPVSPVVGGYVRNPDGTIKRDASGQMMTSGDKPSNNLTSEQAAASEDINITTDPRDVTVKTATVTSDADATVSEVAKPKMPKSFGKDPMSGEELTLVNSAYTVLTGSNDPAERTRAINELATLAGNGYADATPEQVTFAKMVYSDLVSNKTLKEDEVRIGNSIRDLASDTSTTKKPSSTDLSASRPTGVKLGRGEDMPMSARIEASKQSAQSKLDAAKKANRKQYSRDIRSDKYDDTFAQLDKARRDDNIQRNSKPNRVGVNLSEKVGKEKAAKIDDRQGTATNVDKGGNIYYDNDHDWSKSTQTNINSGSSSKGKAIKEDRDEGGTGKIVCTEMYRQTQLDDWAKAMKIWDVYQRKYLTQYHEVGYHWLFKPYVKGMQSSNVLTKLGAFMATKRTKHLKHILTKGIAKDDIVGNIWCKIIHPIVYAAGKIKTWKK